jgi:hypothetical protein
MSSDPRPNPNLQLTAIIEAARRLGVELDEAEALQWLSNIAAWNADDDVTFDERTGVFGHKVVMLDFSPEELAYFREIGRLVEFKDQPGIVETALALSGSSAQSKIQTYPGHPGSSLPHPGRPDARQGPLNRERANLSTH